MINLPISPRLIIVSLILMLILSGITIAVLAYVAPEYLFAAAIGIGALSCMTLIVIVALQRGGK